MNLIVQAHKKKKFIILKMDEDVQLRILHEKDVTDNYINWMNDYEIIKFTEQHYFTHDRKMVKEFVTNKLNSKCNFLFAIFFNNNHIGPIKVCEDRKNINSLLSNPIYHSGFKRLKLIC
mgnify:CR=1 FL=1